MARVARVARVAIAVMVATGANGSRVARMATVANQHYERCHGLQGRRSRGAGACQDWQELPEDHKSCQDCKAHKLDCVLLQRGLWGKGLACH